MKKFCYLLLPLAAAAVWLYGCSEDKEVQATARFVLGTDKLVDLPADRTDFTIAYRIVDAAPGSVATAVSDCDWITVKHVTSEEVTLELQPNETDAQRSGSVELKSAGVAPVTVTLRQAMMEPRIVVSDEQPIVLTDGQTTATIHYQLIRPEAQDDEVTAVSKADWLTVKQVDRTSVTLEATPLEEEMREGSVVLSYAYKGGIVRAENVSVTVRQTPEAVMPVITVEGGNVVEVGVRESEQTLVCTVENGSEENLEAEPLVEWLTFVSKEGGRIVVRVAANYDKAREGGLKLSCDGAEQVVTFKQEARPKPVLKLREDSEVIEADPNGNDERNEDDVLTAYYTIENPIEGMSVTARPSDDWLVISEAYSAFVDFRAKGNDTDRPREGTITLSYKSAEDVTFRVTQGVRSVPVISVTGEQPLRIGRKGTDIVYANFSIENRRGDEKATATPDVDWIHMIITSSGYMGFSVDANIGEEREGRIRLTYRDAEPVDFVVLQAGAPPVGGEGLVLSVSDITATSATVDVVTYIDETYSVGVIPKSNLDKFASDRAFVDELVYQMRQEFAGVPGGFYTFATYFALTNDDSRSEFGVGLDSERLLSNTDYYAFAFDITADQDNNISYSGTLYKKEFRTLSKDPVGEMTFSFSFEGEGTKAKLKCTPSDLTRPYALCVLPKSSIDLSKGAESAFKSCVNLVGEFFTGEAISTSYLSKYTSPFVALACGYDQESGDITSSVALFEFDYPPVATQDATLLRRDRMRR